VSLCPISARAVPFPGSELERETAGLAAVKHSELSGSKVGGRAGSHVMRAGLAATDGLPVGWVWNLSASPMIGVDAGHVGRSLDGPAPPPPPTPTMIVADGGVGRALGPPTAAWPCLSWVGWR
jgi:hypothetical protein